MHKKVSTPPARREPLIKPQYYMNFNCGQCSDGEDDHKLPKKHHWDTLARIILKGMKSDTLSKLSQKVQKRVYELEREKKLHSMSEAIEQKEDKQVKIKALTRRMSKKVEGSLLEKI